jgi:hypothetical protein
MAQGVLVPAEHLALDHGAMHLPRALKKRQQTKIPARMPVSAPQAVVQQFVLPPTDPRVKPL